MITLLTYPAMFGELCASPFGTKAIYLLNMSGYDWQREDLNDPRKMPRQKLPVIRVGDKLIADSDEIRTYLETTGADFDAGLSDLDKATARAFQRMAEEHLYFHIVMDRWGNDAVWPSIREAYFHMIPALMRGIVTRSMRKKLMAGMHAQGLGRLTASERMDRLEPDLQAITARLWTGKFLMGDRPSAVDASVGAMLGAMRATPVETALTRRVSHDAILSGYIDRVRAALSQRNVAVPIAACA
ncbi:MAG: glutathione S-transferase family protein [Sulfitobacter sp.]